MENLKVTVERKLKIVILGAAVIIGTADNMEIAA